MNNVQQNLCLIQNKIHELEVKYGRKPNSVMLISVSKHQSIEKIQEAICAGQSKFGENYLQEAILKIESLADPNLEWHFIGPIQSNKTKKIAENFSWVQSVDSEKIAYRLNEQRPIHLPPLNICLQVNISKEVTKSGIAPDKVKSLAEYCATLPRLRLRGLMGIPAYKETLIEQRAQLHPLKLIYNELRQSYLNLDTLSMGMSDDLEAAIAEGTTMVRIGTAIFGSRK